MGSMRAVSSRVGSVNYLLREISDAAAAADLKPTMTSVGDVIFRQGNCGRAC